VDSWLFVLQTFYEQSLHEFASVGSRAIGGSFTACDGKYRSTMSAEAVIISIVVRKMKTLWLFVSMDRSTRRDTRVETIAPLMLRSIGGFNGAACHSNANKKPHRSGASRVDGLPRGTPREGRTADLVINCRSEVRPHKIKFGQNDLRDRRWMLQNLCWS
jgi:hypothetical protein